MLFSSSNPPPGFYHYLYLREDGTPYYSGKGKAERAWSSNHTIKPPKDKSRILITHWNITEIWAFALERWYIRWYGRKDNGTGILRNGTDGGEGATGCVSLRGVPKSTSHRKNISKGRTGNKYPKLSSSKKGIPQTTESNLKRSATLTGIARPQPLLCCIRCHREVGLNGLIKHQNSKRCKISIPKVITKNIKSEFKIKVMPSKSAHYRYDPTIFTFSHKDGTVVKMPAHDFSLKYNLDRGWLSNVIRGVRRTIKGWSVTQ
jgi:hypothetical protein